MYNKPSRKIMYKTLLPLALITSLHAAPYDNKLEFGGKTTLYDYTERDTSGNILDTEESDLFKVGGIYASYDYRLKALNTKEDSFAYYLNAYASITSGETDYTGSNLINGGGFGSVTNTTQNTFYEYQVNFKRVDFYDTSSRYISVGLGYREWERELSSTQIETYHYHFLQVATGGEKQIYKDWSIGLDLSLQLAYNPEMDADFGETSQTTSLNETFDLGTVYTYKVGIPLTLELNDSWSFTTKAEYEFTSYGRSNTIVKENFVKPTPSAGVSLTEPESEQKNWHLYAGLQYLF